MNEHMMIYPVVSENERKLPVYVLGTGCRYKQEHVVRPNGYPDFQWIQCHSGEGELRFNGCNYTVKQQQGMFLPPNVPHEYYATQEPWIVDWISFGGRELESLLNTIGLNRYGVFYVTNGEAILSKIRKAYAILTSEDALKGFECSTLMYNILIDLLKYISIGNDRSMEQQYLKLQPVFEYVNSHYSDMMPLEDLANVIHVSPQHLCYLFKKAIKIRPFEYINNVRINKSKSLLLQNTELKIQEVAELAGFNDVNYFCSTFKKIEGISPNQFKKLHAAQI